MKSTKKISISILAAMAVMVLSACGGGGGGGSSGTTNSPSANSSSTTASSVTRLTGVNGFKVNYTPNFSSPTAWTGQITSPALYTDATGINSLAVADDAAPAHTYSQASATGSSSGTFLDLNGTNVGGTTYTYARFGWLFGSTTETDNSTTAWYTPFALASTTPTASTDRSYAGTQQALVYLEGDKSAGVSGGISDYAQCDTSASYTASSRTLQLTLSNCSTGVSFNISGGLTLVNGTGTSTLAAQQPTGNLQTITSTAVDSGNFLLAGPNGEELVGAATIKGSIALANGTGSNKPALFFVIFGGKKQ